MGFLILGSFNWGFIGLLKKNVIEGIIGKTPFTTLIYVCIGISAFLLFFNRDTYLPFLGESVFPSSILQEQTPSGATRTIRINTMPHTKVVYWASEPGDNISKKSFTVAYGKYENAGVTTSDASGVAILKIREPQPYKILFVTLRPHVHYRIVKESGFLGPFRTYFL